MRENIVLFFKKIEGLRYFILYFYINSFSFKYVVMFFVVIKLELRMLKNCKVEIVCIFCVYVFSKIFKMVYKMI